MVYRSYRGESLKWRKGSSSQTQNECVEVAAAGPSVLVRDSRDHDAGMLELDSAQWRTLVNAVRSGTLDGR